jgi:hypothetical protein
MLRLRPVTNPTPTSPLRQTTHRRLDFRSRPVKIRLMVDPEPRPALTAVNRVLRPRNQEVSDGI